MNVLLINSTWPKLIADEYSINVYTPEISTAWPPIGLAYIAGELNRNDNLNTHIFDRNSMVYIFNNIEKVNSLMIEKIKEFDPEIIGISATTPLIEDAFSTARIIKRLNPDKKIVLGGVHATALPFEILNKCKDIDIIVIGEGERTMVEICSETPLEHIDGIVYRNNNGKIIKNENRKLIKDIDEINYPSRELLNMDFYLQPSTQIIFGYNCRATSIVSSRGCHGNCGFCAGRILSRGCVRFHSAEYTIKEIEKIISDYKIEGLFFVDEMFLNNRERVIELCNQMIDKRISQNIVWGIQIRVDSVDHELLQLMKKAGCVQVEYGFESGSNRVLKSMNKQITREQIIQASDITRKVGIRQLANIIVGWPYETLKDLEKTVSLLERTKPDFVSWHEFKPLPGSKGWIYALENNVNDCSFENNEPFLFCKVKKEEKDIMKKKYLSLIKKGNINNKNGLKMEDKIK